MRPAVRYSLVAVGAIVLVAALWVGPSVMPGATNVTGAPLSRQELLVGLLCLGVLALAAFGFDLRDWI